MNIPNFVDIKVVDESGFFTPEFKHIFGQLFAQLQTRLSDTGYVIPSQPNDFIDKICAAGVNNLLVVDSVNKELKVILDGAVKTVQTV